MNRLNTEKSPYLLQHADNPVDWYPWCDQAFQAAQREDKLVFLSIGYSTCHWCHVMAKESFADPQIASLLNRSFISVKVDREERPDVDAVYMAACQLFTGTGGWPLTALLTPDKKPFYVGTYFPKHSQYGVQGLMELLEAVEKLWSANRERIFEAGDDLTALLRREEGVRSDPQEPETSILHQAVSRFRQSYDSRWGGFGGAPKFPVAHNLLFLLRYSVLEEDEDCRKMALHTLEAMFRGGLFDQIGGGFSRYSTDEKWLEPHFEKMLTDNALLLLAYLEAFQMTGRSFFRLTAERTLEYVLRELTDEGGGFFCSQDADSDGVEGGYYKLSKQEILQVLGEKPGKEFCAYYSIRRGIVNLLEGDSLAPEPPQLQEWRARLLAYRKERAFLHTDKKILTSWNALMIAALAKASRILELPYCLTAAQKALFFLKGHLWFSPDCLKLRWCDGETATDGQLEDFSFLAYALLELYETTHNPDFLKQAIHLAEQMRSLFEDPVKGGYYRTSANAEPLIFRPKETYDGAIPSGNSMAALVLTRLAALTGDLEWIRARNRQLRFLMGTNQDSPEAHTWFLLALMEVLYPHTELLCVTADPAKEKEFRDFLYQASPINRSSLVKTAENERELAQAAPFTAYCPIPEKGAVYYLCRNGACSAPFRDLEELHQRWQKNV